MTNQDTLPIDVERVIPWIDELQTLLDAGESLAAIGTRLGKLPESIRRDLGPDRWNRPDLLARMSAARVPAPRVAGPTGAAPGRFSPVHEMPRLDPADMACVGQDPDLWFSDDPTDALVTCMGCPVREQCLRGAQARREPWGVWGGAVFKGGQVIPVHVRAIP